MSHSAVATSRADGLAAVYADRRVPCICPRQHEKDPPVGVSLGVIDRGSAVVEPVKCSDCKRRWTRINAR